MSRFDWPGLMQIGLRQLGLAPAQFWELTPAEFMVMSGLASKNSAALNRSGFEALAARFPDKRVKEEE